MHAAAVLARHLKPLCPRDDHAMKYEPGRSASNAEDAASYHCPFEGCTVRYSALDGYYTVIGADDRPYRLAEPGVNTLQCGRHNAWLYRQKIAEVVGTRWCCGIAGCDYFLDAPGKGDWVRT